MVVMMIEMIAPIAIMEDMLGPRATIKMGPSATFGMAFKITKYGSSTLDRKGDHQRIAARMVPKSVPRIKPRTVSESV